ncbi:heparan-alpha-glucosaminide N-acetyltransferase domain-containing protein [Chitinophagaceae bacterium LB-8]|uniref:Heparan-alpha-glucosaminide N-acetyltransferase domain-containing protein n=1 Tax=Paraflavisolibacter caeni TaxID=2982496 RepID=A0A9X2XVW5_9BACT|nr:heparan-alpha-glucosaminide N-acetyltransferase domain-containing protein [Paraflavisolibacter caeni]MCU7549990.1 heparan-alpha-glucosaminide N-acetyltransferase domain-containing protein [Paraflavisolibacter caeni]
MITSGFKLQTAPIQQHLVAQRQRINSIDFLRGLVMVIMALDHVRDFFHVEAMTGDPTDLATTTPWLFFTRWITHFCAPVFVFLAGTSAFLAGQRKTKKELSLFLLKRGFWLVLVEMIVITLGWRFDPLYHLFILQVIWAIGMSMVFLGIMVRLPLPVIFAVGFAIVFGHNLLDGLEAERSGKVGLLWDIFHRSRFSFHPIAPNRGFILIYALGPWAGVMMLGYCFGWLYRKGSDLMARKKTLLALGLSAIISFIILRYINQYGDPAPWSVQRNGIYTVLSFLNTTKYPPSLLYLMMTLGPAILFLYFFERMESRFAKFFITFGRVPFFFYVIHIYFIHLLCLITFFASGYGTKDIVSQTPFLFRPPDLGFNLWIVYGIWLMVVFLLYPLCHWYEKIKMSNKHWILSYL